MKTGKEQKPVGNIHRQQLFYWMGRSIDEKNGARKLLRDNLVKEVLQQLHRSLEKGLWVKSPRYPEEFELRGKSFALDLPIACFTEWSLGESLPHTKEYGRIGLGFPKRWVIERGGQSVTYFRHNEQGSFLQAAFKLLASNADCDLNGVWKPKPGSSVFDEIRYLIHFAKMIRLKRPKPEAKPVVVARPSLLVPRLKKKPSAAAVEAHMFKRKFGMPLQFVEEREWRIVYHPSNKGLTKGPGLPDYYLPYLPGEELFTLVLPDHKVVSKVLQTDWFTERLFTPWKHYVELKKRRVPPVTVLSHSDIGTF
jgi:Putative abortive phage resistance protein AbiGi, antitoxin